MATIRYEDDKEGRRWARWYGDSKRVPIEQPDGSIKKESRKTGQIRLGLVVDEANLLFYRADEGFFQFDPEKQTRTPIPPEKMPSWLDEMALRHICPPVIVDFGGSYFLHELIKGIGYDKIIDSITHANRDRLYAMLQYYLLYNEAAYKAEEWYHNNFVKYLYPKACLKSPRISEFLEALGSDENRRDFLLSHIPYLLKSTDEELCILVDSTGTPNKCDLEYTRVSVHEEAVNMEFRVIVVVQKSTGLPVYYEMIPGNVVDVATLQTVIHKLENMGYHVQYSLGDAAYSCPAVLERLVLSGIDFMTRPNPTYDTYKKTVEEHLSELDEKGHKVLFHGREVKILKCSTVIAIDRKTGKEIHGNVYLCRDINSSHEKSSHLLNSKKAKGMTCDERELEYDRFGLFALVTTIDMKEEDVLNEYCMRQAIEQFFDYAKNYDNYMPVRCHKLEMVKGHLLLGFIATFLLVLIKNRLSILDSPYARIPLTLKEEVEEEDETITVDHGDGTDKEILLEQEPLMSIYKVSPSALFRVLQFQKADVYTKELVPSTPPAAAAAMYNAYHLVSPLAVLWDRETQTISYEFRKHEENKCTRRLAFARRSTLTEEEILKAREEKAHKKAEEYQAEHEGSSHDRKSDGHTQTIGADNVEQKQKRGHGRPPGSKNKKTLEREAELARLEKEGKLPPKRGRGRPPGSKNKKTLEREAAERVRHETEASKS